MLMNENLLEAREELKRLEHIIYVSLKYTRTVDVIINALKRMISTYDYLIGAYFDKLTEEGKVACLPKSPALKAKKLAEFYPEDEIIQKNLRFYTCLRNILKSPQRKRQEFRRHVSLIVDGEDHTIDIEIDSLVNCERFMHRFLIYSRKLIEGEEES